MSGVDVDGVDVDMNVDLYWEGGGGLYFGW